MVIFTRRSNVKIVSRLKEIIILLIEIFFVFFISYPSLENELSIATPFDVPNAKKGNEHILLIRKISLRCSLRRIKLRKAICYKKKKEIEFRLF